MESNNGWKNQLENLAFFANNKVWFTFQHGACRLVSIREEAPPHIHLPSKRHVALVICSPHSCKNTSRRCTARTARCARSPVAPASRESTARLRLLYIASNFVWTKNPTRRLVRTAHKIRPLPRLWAGSHLRRATPTGRDNPITRTGNEAGSRVRLLAHKSNTRAAPTHTCPTTPHWR